MKKAVVLGCGASMGVPAAGGYWGACDPSEPRNERSRASVLLQSDKTNILIDTSYDLRYQLNHIGLKDLSAVLLSHAHSDHVNGLDDLRAPAYNNQKLIDLYADQETLDEIDRRWPYIFSEIGDIYRPFLQKKTIHSFSRLTIGDFNVTAFEQDHLVCKSLGFRTEGFAYSVDLADLGAESLAVLKGVETWVVDAAAYHREKISTHANLKRVLEWVDILKPEMTYLTVMTSAMDYNTLCDELPPHVRPAYDGLEIPIG